MRDEVISEGFFVDVAPDGLKNETTFCQNDLGVGVLGPVERRSVELRSARRREPRREPEVEVED